MGPDIGLGQLQNGLKLCRKAELQDAAELYDLIQGFYFQLRSLGI